MINQPDKVSVEILSFSFKHPLPLALCSREEGAHGGGFIFDCRCLPNPGREERFKEVTGRNRDVIEYLENSCEVQNFLIHTFAVIEQAVENYLSRQFTSLKVGFGCTGGQHRSVYFTDKLQKHLEQKFGDKVSVTINHTRFPELNS